MKTRTAILIVAALILLPGALRPAHAAPFTVVDDSVAADATDADPGDGVCETAAGNGVCTLRAAVMEANALSGADEITVPAGTYTLAIANTSEDAAADGDLDIDSDLTIIGDDAETTVIDGDAIDRVFHILSGTVTIQGVKIQGGHAPNGLSSADGSPGGALLIVDGTVTLSGLIIDGNLAGNGSSGFMITAGEDGGCGGGIAIQGGDVDLSQSTVSNNVAGNGGAGGSDSVIGSAGGGGGSGGGLCVTGGALTVTDSRVNDNHAGNGGSGGFGITIGGSGGAGGAGGGIAFTAGNLTLNKNTIFNNTSGNGGFSGGTIAMAGSGGGGGGVAVGGGTATLLNNTIAGNVGGGGGFGSPTGGSGGSGGGLSVSAGTAILNNDTITDNTPGTGGSPSLPTDGVGGGLANIGGTVNLGNSIIAENHVVPNITFPGTVPDCFGTITSDGFNLIGNGTSCTGPADGVNDDAVGSGGSPIDPLFDPVGLQDNGGPTPTIAIQEASPAKDTADNATCEPTDQRGGTRPLSGPGVCDKGAFELTECGDGAAQSGEECDDGPGNSDTAADACRTDCTNPRCGDNVIDSGETCDDGNTNSGDGCPATCEEESSNGGCVLHGESANPEKVWTAFALMLALAFFGRLRRAK
jgi:cysteine-rich repeat protein